MRRGLPVLVAGVAAVVVLAACSVAFGSRSIPLPEAARALVGMDRSSDAIVITQMRVPRTVLGIVVGAALGLAGAVMQGLTRNALAEPGILGINYGASFAVVSAIYLLNLAAPSQYVPFAFAGAAVAAALVWVLGRGGAGPLRFILGGAVLAALLESWTSAVLMADQRTLDIARFWLAGSLVNRGLSILAWTGPLLAIGAIIAFSLAPALNALALGEETAQALGVNVARVRLTGTVAVVLLSGGAVAVAGPIVFVGLVVPHLVRLLAGPDHRWLLPGCLIVGPVLLLAADILGRLLLPPTEIEVGIVTAFVGAPILAVLARRTDR